MPEASEDVGAPGGGGGDVEQEEYEIRNDDGFVYKVPSGLYPDAAPSSTQPAGLPDPKAAGLRRRRRALLRLRAKRLRDLSRWEALASELLAPLPAPQPPASPAAASSHTVAVASSSHTLAASSSASILDDLLAQVDTQADLMKQAREWCDEVNALCDAREAATVDSIVALPLWGRSPSELMAGLYSPDAHEAATVDSIAALPLWGGKPSELMAGLYSPDKKTASGKLNEQNRRQEASGVSSPAAEVTKKGVKKQTMGHGLPPILTESRLRKRVTNLSGSNNVASPASIEPKRKKASGSTSTAPNTPGAMTRRKAASTPARAPDIVGSPGPLTRRRAAAPKVSPGGSR